MSNKLKNGSIIEFKKGDKVRVFQNTCSHGFKIDEIVTVIYVSKMSNGNTSVRAKNKNGDKWWCSGDIVLLNDTKKEFIIKSSNNIKALPGGLKKDDLENKIRFDVIPYNMLERLAIHWTNGAKKYGMDNWKNVKDLEQAHIFLEAAHRHVLKWVDGQTDEDHMAAAVQNMMMYEWAKDKFTK